jgi:hypothetical protein
MFCCGKTSLTPCNRRRPKRHLCGLVRCHHLPGWIHQEFRHQARQTEVKVAGWHVGQSNIGIFHRLEISTGVKSAITIGLRRDTRDPSVSTVRSFITDAWSVALCNMGLSNPTECWYSIRVCQYYAPGIPKYFFLALNSRKAIPWIFNPMQSSCKACKVPGVFFIPLDYIW